MLSLLTFVTVSWYDPVTPSDKEAAHGKDSHV